MNLKKYLLSIIKTKHKKHFIHIFIVLSVIIISLIINSSDSKNSIYSKNKKFKNIPLRIDTMIPKGFVLIPIEVSNLETLNGVLAQTATGDIYYRANNESILVARFLQILRSPRNPNRISLLAPEHMASKIFKYKGPFFVAIKNPKYNKTLIKEKPKKIFKSRIKEII